MTSSLKQKTIEDPDGSKTVYYYDDLGNKVRVEDIDPQGQLTTIITREHTDSGVCSGWDVAGRDGTLIKRFVVRLDDSGEPIETLQYDGEGNLECRHQE